MNSSSRRVALVSVVAVLFWSGMKAQITVQSSDLARIFTAGSSLLRIHDTTKEVNVGEKGGPNVYDFSTLAFPETASYAIYQSSQIPFLAPRFAPASMVWGNSPQSIDGPVFDLTDSMFNTLGNVTITDTSQTVIHSVPFESILKFPATYGSSWSTSPEGAGTESTYVNNKLLAASSGWNSAENYVVDGYGVLKLPDGPHSCIRLKSVEPDSYTYLGFSYFTKDGIILLIDTRKTQNDTGLIAIDEVNILKGASVTGVAPISSPAEYTLSQNFPNPFNPTTTIRYSIPRNSFVTLAVYDVLGRRVAQLVAKEEGAGSYDATLDGTGLASGVYFYRLAADGYTLTRKMILQK